MTGSRILALGHYQPARILTNEDLSRIVDTNDEWIRSRVGVAQRRIADDETVADMDDAVWAAFEARAIPIPAKVATEKQVLSDPRRYDVPVTVITCEMSEQTLRELITAGHPYVAELAKIRDYEILELPTGHWPMFTKPENLTRFLVASLPD